MVDEKLLELTSRMCVVEESVKSSHKRINDIDRITEGIYKVASNVETLAEQLKSLTCRMETWLSRLEASQRTQGERIGALEKKPAMRWEAMVGQLIAIAVASIAGAFLGRLV